MGRLYLEDWIILFIILFLYKENGIFVDVFLFDYNDVFFIFSYNWFYFFVDVDIVSEIVDFLKFILFIKSLGEFYNFIGFEKYGKIVFYWDYLWYMECIFDKFDYVLGIKGMVMVVFIILFYNMVFKVIKDCFVVFK